MDISILKTTPLFRGMDENEIVPYIFSHEHALRTYKAGDFVAMQNDVCRSLLLLCSGHVRSQMVNGEGKQLTIGHLTAPLLMAPAFVFCSENRFPANIEALDNCEVLFMNKDVFLKFISQYPVAMTNFLTLISNRVQVLSKKLNEFALQSLKTRLLNYLRLHHRLDSQNEVAQIMGVARPSLSRAYAELLSEGCISIEGKETIIDETKALKYKA